MATASSAFMTRCFSHLCANPSLLAGVLILGFLACVALVGPYLVSHDPLAVDIYNRLLPPSAGHWMGTDDLGRDLCARVVAGARVSIVSGVVVVSIAFSIGLLLGSMVALVGGWLDFVVMRLVDVALSLPPLIMAMALTAALGPSLFNALLSLVIVMVPSYIRLARGQALTQRYRGYVESSRLMGGSLFFLLRGHIIPGVLPAMVVVATLDVGMVILSAAALSFIGLGNQPPAPEWGSIIAGGRTYFTSHWWYTLFPGLAILVTALGFNLLGDGLRDLLDPRSRKVAR